MVIYASAIRLYHYTKENIYEKSYTIIASLTIIIAIIFTAVYNSPDLHIDIGKSSGAKLYVEPVTVSGTGLFNLPIPKYKEEHIKEFVSVCDNETKSIFEKYDEGHIETKITVKGHKTIVEYVGTVVNTETGKTENYSNPVVFDFVLTKKLP